MTLLVGDIGGTNSRFGLVAERGLRPADVRAEANDDHRAFEDAVAAYLDAAPERPTAAAFAIAGPVEGPEIRLTNRDWPIDAESLRRRFGFTRMTILNDFVAQALALPHLEACDLEPIGAAMPTDARAKAAVGPGTGLGVAGLLRLGDAWVPVPSEGGHIELAAVDARETAVFARIRSGFGRVSAEHALAGPGLARLYAALAEVDGVSAKQADPAEVTARAARGEARAVETVGLFLRLLARFAGDIALTFNAQGGVYLCGGVVPKLRGLLDATAFRTAFEAKRPHEELMRGTATMVVTSPIAGLIGCAAFAASEPGA